MPQNPDQYRWRETYFVWFPSGRRPTLERVIETIQHLSGHYQLSNGEADAQGLFESLMVDSLDDNSALEIDFATGEDVLLEANRVADDLKPGDGHPKKQAQLPHCDARLEIMHFERFFTGETDEESDEIFDPTALVLVLEALIKLTGGVGVDPQSGMLI